MIQRIQTVFLALVAISMFIMAFTPLFTIANPEVDKSVTLNAMEMIRQNGETLEQTTTVYLMALGLISASLAIGSILQFKNRMNQIKLNFVNTIVMVTTLGITLYFLLDGREFIGSAQAGTFGIGFYSLMAAFIFNMIANRFIRKDEQLVRSSERFR